MNIYALRSSKFHTSRTIVKGSFERWIDVAKRQERLVANRQVELQDPEEEAKSKGGSRLAHDKRIKTYIRKYQQGSYTLQQYWTKIIAAKLDHGLENFK